MSDIFCEHVAAMYGIATESTAPRRISVLELSGGVTLGTVPKLRGQGGGGRGLADVHEGLCKGKHSVEKCPRRGGGGGGV